MLSVPGTDSMRAVSPSLATMALTAASLAPVTRAVHADHDLVADRVDGERGAGDVRFGFSPLSAAARAAPLRVT